MNDRPHMPQTAGFPWATRPEEYRRQPQTTSYIDPSLRGVVAGTAAYDAGAPPAVHAHEPTIAPIHQAASAHAPIMPDLPAPYDWDGSGAVPDELYAMASDLASAGIQGLPAKENAALFAGWLEQLYSILTTSGEGCGADPHTVALAIIQNAPAGPHAVAFALQQVAMQSSLCAPLFTSPLTPPALTRNEIPTPTGTLQIPVKKKPWKGLPWVLGGLGLLTAVGVSWYYMYRSNKRGKRKNPCKCSNPMVVEAVEWEDERENPYGGDGGFTSVDGGVLSEAAIVSPLVNPSRRRKSKSTRRTRR